jgi:hypothetical protein
MVAEPLFAFVEPCLSTRVSALCEEHASLWAATSEDLPVLGPRVGFRQHFANSRAASRLIDELASEVVRVPSAEEERRVWREAVRERLQRFGDARLGWPAGYRRLLFADAFFAASEAFARDARAFDPQLTFDSLYQALRNVWIGNSLQMLLDLPVALGPGLFAYSMLYPVTDNFLDDPRVNSRAKHAFNERLGHRLAGMSVAPRDSHEAAMCRLVDRIEQEFPRSTFAGVYESLLAIHGGQVRSLSQQRGPELPEEELVAISFEKGGSSVLADLYLVAGSATAAQERFAFGYGVVLQLLDDLQDVAHDAAAGHETLFTRAARRGHLDGPTARLVNLIDGVLEADLFAADAFADRKDLIRRNCRTLLVGAVAEQPSRFTRRFRSTVARQWPIGFRALRRLRRRSARRYAEATRTLQRRTGASSPVEWLLAQRA